MTLTAYTANLNNTNPSYTAKVISGTSGLQVFEDSTLHLVYLEAEGFQTLHHYVETIGDRVVWGAIHWA